MSKKANPTVIGVFIVAGVVLLVAGLIVFSSGNLFSKKHKYIVYFEGSMKGLAKGAPVQFKGVTIGSVLDVLIAHNQAPTNFAMPVIIELDEKVLDEKSDRKIHVGDPRKLKQQIDAGLRARLDAASLVTGVLMVQLEFVPNAPPAVFHQLTAEFQEIPSAPTEIQMILQNLGKLDIQGLAEKLDSILDRLNTTLAAINMKEINAGVTNLLTSLDRTVSSPALTNSIESLHRTLDDFGALARKIDSQIDPLAGTITNTLTQANAALAEIRGAVQGLSTMVAPDAPLQTDLTYMLEQLSNAARSLSQLAEFLKRNPDALITGRNPPKEKP